MQTLNHATTGIKRVNPPFWWVGMKTSRLQLLVFAPQIGATFPEIEGSASVLLQQYHKVQNPDYLFIDLDIPPDTESGFFTLVFKQKGATVTTLQYELKAREKRTLAHQGFSSADVVYLIMPDRFANGNPELDEAQDMQEKTRRNNPLGRHGGDLAGIRNHLDYLQDLGVTALWLNPVLENNMPKASYHGYAITDFYRVDPRLGTNETYRQLVKEAHQRGIKIIQDMVFNHCGSRHWMMENLPMHSWIHQFPEFTYSNYRNAAATDPYAAPSDQMLHEKGWFDTTMPDLNQENPFVEQYLTQNSIWWIEYAGLNGIRMDTYPFAEKTMMARWSKRITEEYPNFNIVGEAWMEDSAGTAYWQKGVQMQDAFTPALPSVTDFPLQQALIQAVTEKEGWNTGLARIYYTLTRDFLYARPGNNLIFADNHDMDRLFSAVEGNYNAFRMILAALLTLRGIPQLYYGTEILMDGFKVKGDGTLRQDFPGGWPEDNRNAFTAEGRYPEEQKAREFLRRLLNWRKTKAAVHTGKLIHFTPHKGFYVYFRYNDTDTVMVVLNNENRRLLATKRFSRFLKGYSAGYDVVFDEPLPQLDQIPMPPKSARIIDLQK